MSDYISKDDVLEALKYWKYIEAYETIKNMKGLDSATVCQRCSNHPSNGGSGICHCILGTPIFY